MRRRHTSPWAFVISTTLQVIFVGVLILIPLLYTEAIDLQGFSSTWLAAPPPPPPPPPPPAAAPVRRVRQTSLMDAGKLRAPREIPREIVILKEEPIPQDMGGVAGGVPGGVPGGQIGGVLGGVIGGTGGVVPPPPREAPQRIRVSSGVQEAKVLNRVQPSYPPLASRARIQGTVVLEAIIAKDGTVQNLRVVEGHPMLVQAAVQAVQQWRYQPTILNNEPVE
ncbi:MAG: energy transducer TonB, partial [Acidobacteria bacterium]|nr:energy transducer TonB [Acidobacteriota bacterium]